MHVDDGEAYWDDQVWQVWKLSKAHSSRKEMTETKALFEAQPKETQRLLVALVGSMDRQDAVLGATAITISGAIIAVCIGLALASWYLWKDPMVATFFAFQIPIVLLCHHMLYRSAVRRAAYMYERVVEAGFSQDQMLKLVKFVRIVLIVGFREEERGKQGVTF